MTFMEIRKFFLQGRKRIKLQQRRTCAPIMSSISPSSQQYWLRKKLHVFIATITTNTTILMEATDLVHMVQRAQLRINFLLEPYGI